jgi:hypothetical protein
LQKRVLGLPATMQDNESRVHGDTVTHFRNWTKDKWQCRTEFLWIMTGTVHRVFRLVKADGQKPCRAITLWCQKMDYGLFKSMNKKSDYNKLEAGLPKLSTARSRHSAHEVFLRHCVYLGGTWCGSWIL